MSEEAENSDLKTLTKSLLDVAVESWRFGRLFDRLLLKLDAGEQARYRAQLRWHSKKLEASLTDAGLQIVNLEGHAFDPGIAATPLNIEQFCPEDTLVVDQMLEPIIMGSDGVARLGTVTLRKMES